MTVTWHLFVAELLKARTTRVPWLLLVAMTTLVVALVVLILATAEDEALQGDRGLRSMLAPGGNTAYLFALVLGIIGMAGEYRHGTIGHSLLAAPHRWPIVAAKVVTYALAGLIFGAVAVAVNFAIAGPWMEARDAGWSLGEGLPWKIAAGSLAGCALFGVIGVGLAALVKDQVIALFVGVGWTLLLDSIILGVVPEVGKFLPGGALTGLTNGTGEELLDPPLGGLVLLGYATLLAVGGALAAQRRDLT